MNGYLLIRTKRAWVPWWLWRIATPVVPLARLLSEHTPEACQCPCHETPGMRDCRFCA